MSSFKNQIEEFYQKMGYDDVLFFDVPAYQTRWRMVYRTQFVNPISGFVETIPSSTRGLRAFTQTQRELVAMRASHSDRFGQVLDQYRREVHPYLISDERHRAANQIQRLSRGARSRRDTFFQADFRLWFLPDRKDIDTWTEHTRDLPAPYDGGPETLSSHKDFYRAWLRGHDREDAFPMEEMVDYAGLVQKSRTVFQVKLPIGDIIRLQRLQLLCPLDDGRSLFEFEALTRQLTILGSKSPVAFSMTNIRPMLEVTAADLRTISTRNLDANIIMSDLVDPRVLGSREYVNKRILRDLIPDVCRVTAFLDTFRGPKNQRVFKAQLTYEWAWDLIFPGESFCRDKISSGLSFEQVRPLYDKFDIPCVEVGLDGRVLNKTNGGNHMIVPRTHYLMSTSGHTMTATSSIARRVHNLERTVWTKPKATRLPQSIYKKYQRIVTLDESGLIGDEDSFCLHALLTDSEFAFERPRGNSRTAMNNVRVLLVNGSVSEGCVMMDGVIRPLLTTYKITPEVRRDKSRITDVFVRLKNRKDLHFSISDTMDSYHSEAAYDDHMKHQAVMNREIRNPQTLSFYGEGVAKTMQQPARGGIKAVLCGGGEADKAVDMNSAFVAAMKCPTVPQLLPFHVWREYDPSIDYPPLTCFYTVTDPSEEPTLYSSATHEFHYQKYMPEDFPGRTVAALECVEARNPCPDAFETMLSRDLPKIQKKSSVVREMGMWNSGNEVGRTSYIVQDKAEAYALLKGASGSVFEIDDGFWVVTIDGKPIERLDGFHSWHQFKYDAFARIMEDGKQEIERSGERVIHAVTCDSFKYSGPTYTNLGSEIGGWKEEEIVPENLPVTNFTRRRDNSETFVIPDIRPRSPQSEIVLDDEFDTNDAATKIRDAGNCIIVAKYPGAGKSTAAFAAARLIDEKFLVVTPTNSLKQQLLIDGTPAMTCAEFFGVRMSQSDETDERQFCVKNLDAQVIVIDEIFLNSSADILKWWRFRKAYPQIRLLATGDKNQLPSPAMMWDDETKEKAVNELFPFRLELKIIKRGGGKNMMTLIDELLSVQNESPLQVVQKHVKCTDDYDEYLAHIRTYGGVAYRNEVIQKVAAEAHGEVCAIGNTVLCTSPQRMTGGAKRIKYTICPPQDGSDQFVLRPLPIPDETLNFPTISATRELIRESCTHACMQTAHTMQGQSAVGIGVSDIHLSHVDMRWLIVAVSRARDFDQILLYTGKFGSAARTVVDEVEDVQTPLRKKRDLDEYLQDEDHDTLTYADVQMNCDINVSRETVMRKIKRRRWFGLLPPNISSVLGGRIRSYKDRDIRRGFRVCDLTPESVLDLHMKQDGQCAICTTPINPINISVDAIDSQQGHFRSNCQIVCRSCNSAKR